MYRAEIKQPLFDQFLWVWGPRYQKLKMALEYIHTYPNLYHNKLMPRFYKSSELDYSQTEWIWLCHQLEHPIEKVFFKPWYVFVMKGEYSYFIDLSDEQLPLYTNTFQWISPRLWLKSPVFDKLSDYLLIPDDSRIKLMEHLKRSENKMMGLPEDDPYFYDGTEL